MNVKFLGAASLLPDRAILLQRTSKDPAGLRTVSGKQGLEELNEKEFGFDPLEIDFMILSHAHIDHSGRIPLLTKRGFTGKIYCTDATADLVGIM